MSRPLLGEIVSQKSKSGFFSASELIKVGNKYRVLNDLETKSLNVYFNSSATKEFMRELKSKYGEIKTRGKGKKGGTTWVHPLLFLDIALWIDPRMKVEVYEWLMDNLLKFRNDSGDSYKRMTGALYVNAKNKRNFLNSIKAVASLIKRECGVQDWNSATEEQLQLRNKMHDYIAFACDMLKDPNKAVEIGIQKAKEDVKQ